MNAPVNLNQTTIQTLPTATGLALDKKRYWWLLSPGLPVIGMGILAGYQFGPKATKKIFALGGPLLLHVIIPAIDSLIGKEMCRIKLLSTSDRVIPSVGGISP